LNKEYDAALKCLSKAKTTSNTAELLLGTGICYQKINLPSLAINEFTQLVCLQPSKFKYRFLLMTAFLENKDTLNTLLTAQGIVNLQPKIPSEEVMKFKKQAFQIGLAHDKNFKNKVSTKKLLLFKKQQTGLIFR
jgi:tetratricopeptide (TPR) repeat protein